MLKEDLPRTDLVCEVCGHKTRPGDFVIDRIKYDAGTHVRYNLYQCLDLDKCRGRKEGLQELCRAVAGLRDEIYRGVKVSQSVKQSAVYTVSPPSGRDLN